MSHFTVLVIGEDVDRQLAPFHEFECTGRDDEYVQTIDKTEEAREEYLKDTERMYVSESGEIVDAYDDRFYRDPTEKESKQIGIGGTGCCRDFGFTSKDWGDGKGYRPKVHFLPEGFEEKQIPTPEVKDFAEFVQDYYGMEIIGKAKKPDLGKKHKYGWCRVDKDGKVIEVIRRTNPNDHWDWYQVGGRWSGLFQMKDNRKGKVGETAFMCDPAKPGTSDQALKGDIDFERMRAESLKEKMDKYDKAVSIIAGRSFVSWDRVKEENGQDINRSREIYGEQQVIKDFQHEFFFDDIENYCVAREEYLEKASKSSGFSTFAVIKDSKWYEKGRMGWWAMVHDEKDEDEWCCKFNELIDSVPDDTLLTIVDCHI